MKIGIFGIITVIFILAKLFNIITWSWWLVFSPIFIGFTLFVSLFCAAVLFQLKWKG